MLGKDAILLMTLYAGILFGITAAAVVEIVALFSFFIQSFGSHVVVVIFDIVRFWFVVVFVFRLTLKQ